MSSFLKSWYCGPTPEVLSTLNVSGMPSPGVLLRKANIWLSLFRSNSGKALLVPNSAMGVKSGAAESSGSSENKLRTVRPSIGVGSGKKISGILGASAVACEQTLAGTAGGVTLAVGGGAVSDADRRCVAFPMVRSGADFDGSSGTGGDRCDRTRTRTPPATNKPTTASQNKRFNMSRVRWVCLPGNSGRYQKRTVAARVLTAAPTNEFGDISELPPTHIARLRQI